MKTIYVITDTHFGHEKMIEYCGRPQNFEEVIFSNLSKISNAQSILIHLGDFCIGKDAIWHERFVNTFIGTKILTKGNHDNKTYSWYYSHGWDFVCESFSINFNRKNIVFSHQPVKDTGFDINIHGHFHNNLPRLLEKKWVVPDEEKRNEDVLKILTPKHKLIALEYNHYSPQLLTTILK